MTLSPEDHAALIDRMALATLEEIRATEGGLDALTILPLSVCAQLLGITRQHAARILPVTVIGGRTKGVSRAAIRSYIEANTSPPRRP